MLTETQLQNFIQSNASTPLPPIIHFIWIGGTIPTKYLHKLFYMAVFAKESQFQIKLWVDDEKNYTTALAQYIKGMKYNLDLEIKKAFNISIRSISELLDSLNEENFYKENPGYAKDFKNYLMREMIGFKNLASAADLLRYEILRREGGYYYDIDTYFGLRNIFSKKCGINTLYNSKLLFESLTLSYGIQLERNKHSFNNDIIFTLASHPVIEEILKLTIDRYRELDTTKQDHDDYYLRSFKIKIHNNATQFDMKRYPNFPHRPYMKDLHWDNTLYTGPGVVDVIGNKAMQFLNINVRYDCTFRKASDFPGENPINSFSLSKMYHKRRGMYAFFSNCDNNWRNNKITQSFDDSALVKSL